MNFYRNQAGTRPAAADLSLLPIRCFFLCFLTILTFFSDSVSEQSVVSCISIVVVVGSLVGEVEEDWLGGGALDGVRTARKCAPPCAVRRCFECRVG